MVRVVHSLFAETDDWDDQLEGTESGWPVYFRVLWMYLNHFRSMTGRSLVATAISPEPELQTWNQLIEELGLSTSRRVNSAKLSRAFRKSRAQWNPAQPTRVFIH